MSYTDKSNDFKHVLFINLIKKKTLVYSAHNKENNP